jgi:hypothetical protein
MQASSPDESRHKRLNLFAREQTITDDRADGLIARIGTGFAGNVCYCVSLRAASVRGVDYEDEAVTSAR